VLPIQICVMQYCVMISIWKSSHSTASHRFVLVAHNEVSSAHLVVVVYHMC